MSSATIAAAGFAPSLPALPAAPILPLETGDCMNRAEFRRRSDAMPHLERSPEFVAEISASTTSIDSHLKLQAYRRNGIREYLIWRVLDRQIDWFTLEREQYVKLPLDKDGIIRSRVFPGLWLDVEALVSQRRKRVYAVLKQGKASPEFAAFAAEVAKHADPAAGD